MQRWFASIVIVLSAFGNSAVSQKTTSPITPAKVDLTDLIDFVRPSVVQISVKTLGTTEDPVPKVPAQFAGCFQGGIHCIAGTGFFVNSKGDVITAFHVVDGFVGQDGQSHPGIKQVIDAIKAEGGRAEIEIGVSMPNFETTGGRTTITLAAGTVPFPATVGPTDPSHDIALVRPSVNPFEHMPTKIIQPTPKGMKPAKLQYALINVARPRDGEAIFTCGYPFSEPDLKTTVGTLASVWKSTVLVRAQAAGFSHPQEALELDLAINPGNSGGPVFRTSDHSLIGVAVQSHGTIGTAVPAKFVAAFLTENGVSWSPSKSASGPKQKVAHK